MQRVLGHNKQPAKVALNEQELPSHERSNPGMQRFLESEAARSLTGFLHRLRSGCTDDDYNLPILLDGQPFSARISELYCAGLGVDHVTLVLHVGQTAHTEGMEDGFSFVLLCRKPNGLWVFEQYVLRVEDPHSIFEVAVLGLAPRMVDGLIELDA
jgi:hypothetical protein